MFLLSSLTDYRIDITWQRENYTSIIFLNPWKLLNFTRAMNHFQTMEGAREDDFVWVKKHIGG